jgi:leader peptidase (prepilin peptidase)/N-methyltransferase
LALVALPPVGWAVAALWGALWGSFFNVCIYRIGLYESVVRPASRCPSCGRAIAARDNVPVLGWLLLGGRCRGCGASISVRYPLVELLSTGLAVAVYARFVAGESADVVALVARFFIYFAFLGVLLVLSGIDLDHLLIPDRVTYPAIPIFFVCGVVLRDVPARDLVIGAFAGYGLVALFAEGVYLLLGREGMGYGDAKLLSLVGALLGWRSVLFTFFGAPFFGLLLLVPLRMLQRKKITGVEVPYGPFLAAAAAAYLFFGRALVAMVSGG